MEQEPDKYTKRAIKVEKQVNDLSRKTEAFSLFLYDQAKILVELSFKKKNKEKL